MTTLLIILLILIIILVLISIYVGILLIKKYKDYLNLPYSNQFVYFRGLNINIDDISIIHAYSRTSKYGISIELISSSATIHEEYDTIQERDENLDRLGNQIAESLFPEDILKIQ